MNAVTTRVLTDRETDTKDKYHTPPAQAHQGGNYSNRYDMYVYTLPVYYTQNVCNCG